MRAKTFVLRSLSGLYVHLNGPFEYIELVSDPQQATPMPGWKAFQWAACVKNLEAVAVG